MFNPAACTVAEELAPKHAYAHGWSTVVGPPYPPVSHPQIQPQIEYI